VAHHNFELGEILAETKIIPVITIPRIEDALPLAKALYDGGLTTLEITLRSDCALEAIKIISQELPNALIGAGTVNDPGKYQKSVEAGADFVVSPGFTSTLLDCAEEMPIPYLPGIATPSEAMQLADRGYLYLKCFPAEALNARKLLKAIYGPIPDLRFCPTGGIGYGLAHEYLALPNVMCLGGSWITPKGLVSQGKWSEIQKISHEASLLK